MSKKNVEEKETFWQRYKLVIICLLGAVLLISFIDIQNVVLVYQTEDATQYAVKMDYSVFGMCIRCTATTNNAHDVMQETVLFGTGREKSLRNAAAAMQKVAAAEDGTFRLRVGGLALNNDELQAELIAYLNGQGYSASPLVE